jgi:hypothetical protein
MCSTAAVVISWIDFLQESSFFASDFAIRGVFPAEGSLVVELWFSVLAFHALVGFAEVVFS